MLLLITYHLDRIGSIYFIVVYRKSKFFHILPKTNIVLKFINV